MNPRDKAFEIFNKYLKLHSTSNQMKFRAIESSLFLVEEIIKDRERLKDALFYESDYWEKVKEILNNF